MTKGISVGSLGKGAPMPEPLAPAMDGSLDLCQLRWCLQVPLKPHFLSSWFVCESTPPDWILVLWYLSAARMWRSWRCTGMFTSALFPQLWTSRPDPRLLLTSVPTQVPVVIHPHPLHPPTPHSPVETGLVWLPTVEMMDWRPTYGKGQGPSSKQVQSCIKYERGKGKHSLPFGSSRVDRYVVYSACVKSPALTCCLLKATCLCSHSGQFSSK